jgi:hypothetical protein
MATRTTVNTTLMEVNPMATKTMPVPKTIPRTLEICEVDVESGLRGTVSAGRALAEIKANGLYKDRYGFGASWKKYCFTRWGMSEPYANQLIKFAGIVAGLVDSKQVPFGNLPKTESAARPLNQSPQKLHAEAWNEAVEMSAGNPSANDVQKAVDKRKLLGPKPGPKPRKDKPSAIREGKYREFAVQTLKDIQPILDKAIKMGKQVPTEDWNWFAAIAYQLEQTQKVLRAGIPEVIV